MSAEIISISEYESAIWLDYVRAKNAADLTGKLEDGRRASRAWRRWLDFTMTEAQKNYLSGRMPQ